MNTTEARLMKPNRKRPVYMTLDEDTLAALSIIADAAKAAGLPCDGTRWGRSAAVRLVVRGFEKHGGLQELRSMEIRGMDPGRGK